MRAAIRIRAGARTTDVPVSTQGAAVAVGAATTAAGAAGRHRRGRSAAGAAALSPRCLVHPHMVVSLHTLTFVCLSAILCRFLGAVQGLCSYPVS